jgi:hypothetical protein
MTEHKPWLSLPDEDPPERGLAELMAAARVKAEIMARPPWWKRALDVMKRPPVLALATVVVLVGGVIVVGHHKEDVQTAAPAVQPPPEAAPVLAPAAGSAAMPTPPAPEEVPPATPPAPPPPPPPKVEKHRETKPITKALPPLKPAVVTGTSKLELAEPAADDEAETVQKAPVPRAEPLSVQLGRCRAAATHKDCAGARTCAKQLEQRDRAFYDTNAANDADLKPCL